MFRWRDDSVEQPPVTEYGPTNVGEVRGRWQRARSTICSRPEAASFAAGSARGETEDFAILVEMRAEGQTDYVAFVHRFGVAASSARWIASTRPGPPRAPAAFARRISRRCDGSFRCWRSRSRRLAHAHRAHPRRGLSRPRRRSSACSADALRAVSPTASARSSGSRTCAATRRSPTRAARGDHSALNDYAGPSSAPFPRRRRGAEVHRRRRAGDLPRRDPAEACRRALRAEVEPESRHRSGQRAPRRRNHSVTSVYLGLHIGEVFYGNIGSERPPRLHRRRARCQRGEPHRSDVPIGRPPSCCSSDFAAATPEPERSKLVSVGRYALRGVGRAEELFTLDPALQGPA